MKRRGLSAKTVTDKVADASAIVALLFNELKHEEIVHRLREATLRAPSLIGFEVANACLKKIRAAPAEREALLEAFSFLDTLSISLEPVNLDAADVHTHARFRTKRQSFLCYRPHRLRHVGG